MSLYESLRNNLNESDNIAVKSKSIKPKVVKGKTLDEYMKKFGDAYNSGELWDVDIEDVKSGALEPNNDVEYWEIDGRYYEAPVLKEAETSIGNAVAEEVKRLYKKDLKDFYAEAYPGEDAPEYDPWDIDAGYGNADLSIVVDGDWKHDHAYCDNLVKQAAAKLGYSVKTWEEVIDPSEDDSYASIHFYDFIQEDLNEADIKDAELITIPKEIVDKVNAEHEKEKPAIKKEIQKEYDAIIRRFKRKGYSQASLDKIPAVKAVKDAANDPDDIWCECGNSSNFYKEDGYQHLGVTKHGWVCDKCYKYQQIG